MKAEEFQSIAFTMFPEICPALDSSVISAKRITIEVSSFLQNQSFLYLPRSFIFSSFFKFLSITIPISIFTIFGTFQVSFFNRKIPAPLQVFRLFRFKIFNQIQKIIFCLGLF